MTCASSELVWREKKTTEQETTQIAIRETCGKKQHSTVRKPGAPRDHTEQATGIKSHKSGAIPRPAMTPSRSRRKGETESETELK